MQPRSAHTIFIGAFLATATSIAHAAPMDHHVHAVAQNETPAPADAASPAQGADLDARIGSLEEQVRALQKQLEELRAERTAAPPTVTEPVTAPPAGEQPSMEHGHAMGGPGLSLGSVTVGGMLEMQFTSAVGGSLKQPIFSNPKGNSDFILTHVHPMLSATLNDKTSAMVMWCLSHVGTTALYQAYLDYQLNDAVDIKAGRWLLPFGAWNPISNPAQFPTVSRPLMYLGHEERNIVLQGGPRPIMNDEQSDLGLLVSGQHEVGPALLAYNAWVSNGYQDTFGDYPDAWIDFRPTEDNNSDKAVGGRLALTRGGLTFGGSYTTGRYDPANSLRYRVWGLDATWRAPSGLTLRAEYAANPYERAGAPDARRRGWYAMAEHPIGPRWDAVAMYSTLTEKPATNVETVSRVTLGLDYEVSPSTLVKTEIGRLLIGSFVGDPATAPQGGHYEDVTTYKVSTVTSF